MIASYLFREFIIFFFTLLSFFFTTTSTSTPPPFFFPPLDVASTSTHLPRQSRRSNSDSKRKVDTSKLESPCASHLCRRRIPKVPPHFDASLAIPVKLLPPTPEVLKSRHAPMTATKSLRIHHLGLKYGSEYVATEKAEFEVAVVAESLVPTINHSLISEKFTTDLSKSVKVVESATNAVLVIKKGALAKQRQICLSEMVARLHKAELVAREVAVSKDLIRGESLEQRLYRRRLMVVEAYLKELVAQGEVM
ncbi:hypothetical protein P7C70_g934, partial [Phenoliferia sp. Uapishka_3]